MTTKEEFIQEFKDHFNEPILFHLKVVRCVGFAEDPYDYYMIIKTENGKYEEVSAFMRIIYLNSLFHDELDSLNSSLIYNNNHPEEEFIMRQYE